MSLQLAPMASGAVGLPPAAPQGSEPAQVHVVRAGETLFSICEWCNTILASCVCARTPGRALLSATCES